MIASRLIIAGVAVAAAGGAGYIAKNMSAPPPPQIIVEGPAQPAVEATEVLVLVKDLPMGATIVDELAWQEWPSNAVADAFITRDEEPEAVQQLSGSVARLSMYQGEPLRKSKLIGEGQNFMAAILPSGKRAIATQIAADTAAGGFILPNDFVDVIMSRRSERPGAGEGFVTETILKNIRVLAIDQTITEDEEGKKVKVGETATLELTPEQAEIITVAQQMADRLTLSLRSVKDAQDQVEAAEYLVSGNGRRGTVRMIKSGEVSEVGARQ